YRPRSAVVGGVWRRARCSRHDHPRRHQHGHPARGAASNEGCRRENRALECVMEKAGVLSTIREIGIIPVIRAENSAQALLDVEALAAGGIPIAEITMTVPDAIYAIRECCRVHGSKILTGAGTVLNAKMARDCVDAGAQFLASPGLDLETLRFGRERQVLIIPGTLTPTEIMAALKHGAEV